MAFKLDELSSKTTDIEPTDNELDRMIEPPPVTRSIRRPRSKGLITGSKQDSLKIGDRNITTTLKYVQIDDCKIWPGNARHFEALTLNDVEDILPSIESQGVLEPLLGRKGVSGYEIIDGSRRLLAAKCSGLEELPIRVTDLSDDEAELLTVVTNNNTRLSAYEIGLFSTKNFGKYFSSDEDVYKNIGVSRANFYRCKNIARLPSYVMDLIKNPNDIPLLSGDELFRKIKEIIKLNQDDEFKMFCTEQNVASAEVTVSLLLKWFDQESSAVKKGKTLPKGTKTSSESFKNSSGKTVLKSSMSNKGTLKIELLVQDDAIRRKLLDFARKITGS